MTSGSGFNATGFSTIQTTVRGSARIGQFVLAGQSQPLQTPSLFPVACFMTGPSARGGGLWKYILHADSKYGLMRRGLPIMSQALHFLDFSLSPNQLRDWREIGIRNRYNAQFAPDLSYQAPIFLDSGGFKLLWNETLDLSHYNLCVKHNQGPEKILQLQQDLGGNIVATLDYPLPPNLSASEAKTRMAKSRGNAVAAARLLQDVNKNERPFLHVAAHGQNREDIFEYGNSVLQSLREKELDTTPFGLAVGSLVPLRMASNHVAVVNLIMGLRESMKCLSDAQRATVPVHAFGVTGTLIPVLAYLGVDSFDSSTYVQKGRNMIYIHPDTYKDGRVLEMDDMTCQCRVCQATKLPDLHHALLSQTKNQPQKCGYYKSKYYGDICLHNLEMDFRILEETRKAIAADEMHEFLVAHAERFPELGRALHAVAAEDEELRVRLSRTSFALPQASLGAGRSEQSVPRQPALPLTTRAISLDHKPEDFDISANGYRPPGGKSVLLIVPCSETKPYSDSRTHQYLTHKLEAALGQRWGNVHKVTLSGLYGPVPEEREQDDPILTYDFRLDAAHTEQVALVARRLANYIRRHHEQYELCLGYATSLPYRLALENAALLLRQESEQDGIANICFQVLPAKPKSRRLSEFFRHTNIEELVDALNTFDGHNNAGNGG